MVGWPEGLPARKRHVSLIAEQVVEGDLRGELDDRGSPGK